MSRLPIPFDNPATYVGHSGVDFPKPRGTIVKASGPGRIGLRSSNARGGLLVWVDYDGFPGVGYAHLDDYRDSPPVGTRVREGDTVCRVGNSGFSTGPHLHMEVDGHATTAGFWRFFDRNKVVGQGTPAGGGGAPLPKPDEKAQEDTTMYLFSETNGSFYLAKPGGIVGVRGPSELTILRRLLQSKPGGEDRFNAAERDIIAYYMKS